MLVSDALTTGDAVGGKALCGREGAMLARALSRYGWKFTDFWLASAAFCAPAPGMAGVCAQTCSALDAHIRAIQPKVFVTLGAHAFTKLTGLRVPPLLARGYVWPALSGGWVVAALPPLYYRQDPGMVVTFQSDVAKAVRIARDGFAYDETIRTLWQPDPATWEAFVAGFLANPTQPLAADIETPWKRKADMTEAEKAAADDASYTIDEVNLCYDGRTGASVPWAMEGYRAGGRAMLAASQAHGVTLFWNRAYDGPRLEHNGFPAFDLAHTRDAMDTFRVWRNGVRRKLAVATSMLPSCWNVRPWKHLGTADPFYRAMDVVSLWRNDADLLALLSAEGQADVHQLCVARLDPHLDRMTRLGVNLDLPKIDALYARTGARLTEMQAQMTRLVPEALRPTQTWQTLRAAQAGLARLKAAGEVTPGTELHEGPAEGSAGRCDGCGEVGVDAAHVTRKRLKPPTTPSPAPIVLDSTPAEA